MAGRPLTRGELDDGELVERAREGEGAAYAEIVSRYQEIAFRTAYVITRSAADAEDAAQDAFIKAHAALGRFRTADSLRPWLLRIVANEARNRRRAGARRERLAVRAASDRGAASGDAAPSPEAALMAAERHGELLRALERLREEERTAIACRYFLDLSEAETAGVLGCRRGTVKSRLSRGLARLRAEVEPDA